MKKLIITFLLIASISMTGSGQRKIVNIPDIPGYITLKCDFHLHTVFSDGNVWPTNRITEAHTWGLDAVSITDHLEYLPHKDYVKADHNAAWKITEEAAKERNIILVHGTEITRPMPPGHLNALFIKDAAALVKDSVIDVVEEAVRQGAFILWNHPGWKSQQPDGIPRMYDIHHKLVRNRWLHGIEFFNYSEYYPRVLTFCKDNNLAVFANSDVHGNISEDYTKPEHTNRPMTLVFAKARTHDSLKEAMFAGRTLAYFKDMIAGKEEYARPFFNACITVDKPYYENERSIFFEVTNRSDIPFDLINGTGDAPPAIRLAANSVTRVVLSKKATFPLVYDIKNIMTGEDEMLKVKLEF